MTLQAANRLTAAETQLIDAYTHQIGSLPGDGAVLLKRDGLFDALKRQGLPTRRVETFHYTDLKALLTEEEWASARAAACRSAACRP